MDYIDIAIKEDNIYYLPFDQIKNMLESGKAELIWINKYKQNK